MGKGKKVTVSFWYKLIVLIGWCKGPIDALLEIRGGDRTAWSGRQETDGIINVDNPDLYGGETAEGGIQGEFEVMMGGSDQAPNEYMIEHFGDHQPGRRGKSMILLRGPKIGAGNPYPKSLYFKLERILKGWDDDVCWYPEKARIGGEGYSPGAGASEFLFISGDDVYRANRTDWEDQELVVDINGGLSMDTLLTAGNNMICWQTGVTGSLRYSTDAGATWATPPGFASWTPRQGFVDDDGNFWITDNSVLIKSATLPVFVDVGPGGSPLAGFRVIGADNFIVNYADYYNQTYSVDGGGTWSPCTTTLDNLHFSLAFARDTNRVGVIDLNFSTYEAGFALNTNGSDWTEYLGVIPVRLGGDPPYPVKLLAFKGKWVAFFQNGDIAYGDQGNWDLSPFIPPGSIFDAATDGETVFAVGFNGLVISSTDGLAWTVETAPEEGLTINSIAFYSDPGTPTTFALGMMNPAHVVYDAITSRRENGGMGEPIGRVNDASFRAAADLFYDEMFGVCCTWYGGESAEQFIQRICTVAGMTMSQSSVDGQYYLFPLRLVDNAESLPVILDDDIIEFEAEPALPPESINQMQVKWFDPQTREERITPPVQALGAIEDAGGVIAEVREYYEIPYEELALRVAQRDLQSFSSALWRLRLVCNARVYGLQKGMQVRLVAPKRGFADMIVIVGDVDEGTLADQEISLVLLQDVFSLPDAAFIEAQPPLAPPPIGDPINIEDVIAIESPYVELAASMREADLQLVDPETGFLVIGAVQPGNGTQYQVATKAAGEEYETYGNGDWTPSATVIEAAPLSGVPQTAFTFEAGTLLDRVETGTWAMWGGELCRIDALDIGAGTLSLGRAVADTVPQEHAAGETIYFIGEWYGTDQREYVDSEVVTAKAQNRTGQGLIPLDLAPSASTTMASRQVRPYPPANVTINGGYFPAEGEGDVAIAWAHRDRLLQADQLVPWGEATVALEPGTVYNARLYLDNVLVDSELAMGAGTWTFPDPGSGMVRVELEAERDGYTSWQIFSHEVGWGAPVRIADSGDTRIADSGDTRILEG